MESPFDFDEGPDLTRYYRMIAVSCGVKNLERPADLDDQLTVAQAAYAKSQLSLFQSWYANWS